MEAESVRFLFLQGLIRVANVLTILERAIKIRLELAGRRAAVSIRRIPIVAFDELGQTAKLLRSKPNTVPTDIEAARALKVKKPPELITINAFIQNQIDHRVKAVGANVVFRAVRADSSTRNI